ncbi:PRD domain-containing protein [Anaerostipes hadrus]|jgi:transcriptional regulatory protein LevR/transcriptional regulator with AAA-type ATPase domain|uniref:PRD domain-containing protein n=1 Tax=Anaerostipes hadrus TaxID=649756 RepID=UPI0015712ED9|nr:PRD domain-containing protein [Anaerostipes hadrus]NSH29913.1 PRD domain-containing protein [Anaerostipes hadrus]NSH43311.1 PRD domain-containing protein [Anaerostipes hadrus]
MKLKKEQVLEFITEYSSDLIHDEFPKITTRFLSEKLKMQRTNISSILNQLVNEGKLVKYNGRPVLYQLADENTSGNGDVFEQLVGYDSSLKEAIASAKAAVLYPEGNPTILITAKHGSGVSHFAKTVFRFAQASGKLKTRAPWILWDCKTLFNDQDKFQEIFLGDHEKEGILKKASGGMLILENIDVVSERNLDWLLAFLRGEKIQGQDEWPWQKDYHCITIFSTMKDTNEMMLNLLRGQMDFRISLPSLEERSIEERFLILQKFFKEEAKAMDRMIEVDTSILHALLLYEVTDDIKGLKNDIHTGCANSYVRSYNTEKKTIVLLMSDFPNYVRKGIMYYRSYKNEIDEMIKNGCKYTFYKNQMLRDNKTAKKDIYQSIDARKRDLERHALTEEEINMAVSNQLESEFEEYFEQLCERVDSIDTLNKMVSEKLISLTRKFLLKAAEQLSCKFSKEIFCGICLHVNSCLIKVSKKQRISNEEIARLLSKYPMHYELVKEFQVELGKEFNVKLNVDDLIFLLMFLLEAKKDVNESKVVTLIAMHGSHAASSIAAVVNVLSDDSNVQAFDMDLDKNVRIVYEELKEKIIKIDQGKGILLIYDMGSIHTMAESIAQETKIAIRCVEVPITLVGIAGSSKAAEMKTLDEVADYLQDNFSGLQYFRAKPMPEMKPEIEKNEEIIEQMMEESSQEESINEVFEYLGDQFPQFDIDLMKNYLLVIIGQIEHEMNLVLDEDKKIGLIVHIVCLIDKLQQQHTPSVNFMAYSVLGAFGDGRYGGLFEKMKTFLKPLEETFDVMIQDNEIATIISIICK